LTFLRLFFFFFIFYWWHTTFSLKQQQVASPPTLDAQPFASFSLAPACLFGDLILLKKQNVAATR